MSGPAYKPLVQLTNAPTSALTASVATYYTVPDRPDNAITIVRGMILSNTDTSALTVQVYNVASGGSAAQTNAILYNVSIPANTVVQFSFGEGEWVMTAGMTIQAKASSASVVTLTLGGCEIVP